MSGEVGDRDLYAEVNRLRDELQELRDESGLGPQSDTPTSMMEEDIPRQHKRNRVMAERLDQIDPWKYRAQHMRCQTCMWFVRKALPEGPGALSPLGRCRHHSPTMKGYPAVFLTDWCGDHKLDETKL